MEIGDDYDLKEHDPAPIPSLSPPYEKKPWEIDLRRAGFWPTATNYSRFGNDACIICQDYSEIDAFARACALPNLWDLSFEGLPEQGVISKSPPGFFNVVTLLEGFRQLRKPLGKDPTLRAFLEVWAKAPIDNTTKLSPTQMELDTGVAAFGKTLWWEFLKARRDPTTNNLDERLMTDYVAAARLMFSWVSFSLTYDHDLAKEMTTVVGTIKSLKQRSLTNALVTGNEICLGYSRMFQILLNAATGTTHARLIKGLAYAPHHGSTKKGFFDSLHAWSAFPVVDDAVKLAKSKTAGAVTYKVIDATWAQNNATSVDRLWWSFSNAAFAMTHVPLTDSVKTYVQSLYTFPTLATQDLFVPVEVLPRRPGSAGTGPLSSQELWELEQPTWYNSDELYWIDISTLEYTINVGTGGNERRLTVTFKNNCKHQKKTMPDTWLYFRAATTRADFEYGMAKTGGLLPYMFDPLESSGKFLIEGIDTNDLDEKEYDAEELERKESDSAQLARNKKSATKYDSDTWSASVSTKSPSSVKGVLLVVGAFTGRGKRIHKFDPREKNVSFKAIIGWEI